MAKQTGTSKHKSVELGFTTTDYESLVNLHTNGARTLQIMWKLSLSHYQKLLRILTQIMLKSLVGIELMTNFNSFPCKSF